MLGSEKSLKLEPNTERGYKKCFPPATEFWFDMSKEAYVAISYD